jgi:hypothetical protein
MLRTAPSTVFIAASTEAALRSGTLVPAILRSCSLVMVPTGLPLGEAAPFCSPAASRKSAEVSGV